MAKISYANLKLKVNNTIKTFNIGTETIEVLQYLPIEDKDDLIAATLQKSKEVNGLYNPLKIDMYLHLHIVYMYTNLNFTDKQKEDEYKLYDVLYSNQIITNTLAVIPEEEYNILFDAIQEYIKMDLEFNTTFAAVVKSIINDLPAQAEAMQNIVNTFDPEKYQAVIDFAKAANGGRAI